MKLKRPKLLTAIGAAVVLIGAIAGYYFTRGPKAVPIPIDPQNFVDIAESYDDPPKLDPSIKKAAKVLGGVPLNMVKGLPGGYRTLRGYDRDLARLQGLYTGSVKAYWVEDGVVMHGTVSYNPKAQTLVMRAVDANSDKILTPAEFGGLEKTIFPLRQ
jgi:hypothetical protein